MKTILLTEDKSQMVHTVVTDGVFGTDSPAGCEAKLV